MMPGRGKYNFLGQVWQAHEKIFLYPQRQVNIIYGIFYSSLHSFVYSKKFVPKPRVSRCDVIEFNTNIGYDDDA